MKELTTATTKARKARKGAKKMQETTENNSIETVESQENQGILSDEEMLEKCQLSFDFDTVENEQSLDFQGNASNEETQEMAVLSSDETTRKVTTATKKESKEMTENNTIETVENKENQGIQAIENSQEASVLCEEVATSELTTTATTQEATTTATTQATTQTTTQTTEINTIEMLETQGNQALTAEKKQSELREKESKNFSIATIEKLQNVLHSLNDEIENVRKNNRISQIEDDVSYYDISILRSYSKTLYQFLQDNVNLSHYFLKKGYVKFKNYKDSEAIEAIEAWKSFLEAKTTSEQKKQVLKVLSNLNNFSLMDFYEYGIKRIEWEIDKKKKEQQGCWYQMQRDCLEREITQLEKELQEFKDSQIVATQENQGLTAIETSEKQEKQTTALSSEDKQPMQPMQETIETTENNTLETLESQENQALQAIQEESQPKEVATATATELTIQETALLSSDDEIQPIQPMQEKQLQTTEINSIETLETQENQALTAIETTATTENNTIETVQNKEIQTLQEIRFKQLFLRFSCYSNDYKIDYIYKSKQIKLLFSKILEMAVDNKNEIFANAIERYINSDPSECVANLTDKQIEMIKDKISILRNLTQLLIGNIDGCLDRYKILQEVDSFFVSSVETPFFTFQKDTDRVFFPNWEKIYQEVESFFDLFTQFFTYPKEEVTTEINTVENDEIKENQGNATKEETQNRIYGYAMVTTHTQSTQMQEKHILNYCTEAKIYIDSLARKKDKAIEFDKLLKHLKNGGGCLIIDSIRNLAKTAPLAFEKYKLLFDNKIELIFLQESHLNTAFYYDLLSKQETTEINTVKSVLLATIENIIKGAFTSLYKRKKAHADATAKGIETAKSNGAKIGNQKGERRQPKEKAKNLRRIKSLSQFFNGSLSDYELAKKLGITRQTVIKYRNELREMEKNA